MTENSYDLEEFAKLHGDSGKLNLLEKALCVTTGPVLGMLPPPMQRNIAGEEGAALMSKTSRYVNALLGVYGLASLGCKIFGADIDPTPGEFGTWAGVAFAVDSLVRETLNGAAYVFQHPNTEHLKVWGEPIVSMLYNSLFERQEASGTNPLK